MRSRCLAIMIFFCGLQSLSAAQQSGEFEAIFVDKTAQGSPLSIVSERVVVDEELEGSQLRSSWGGKIVAKNASEKPILLSVAGLSLAGRHNRGSVRGPGDGATYFLSDDRFFTTDTIEPGDTLRLWDATPRKGQSECCINPSDQPNVPRAEFRVRFVQFADGSTFGDPSQAENDLAIRATITNGLRKLVQSYAEHGERAFTADLERVQAWSSSSVFAKIRTAYDAEGAIGALAQARQILAVVESHELSIGQPARSSTNPAP
jgi:hypothetical protein